MPNPPRSLSDRIAETVGRVREDWQGLIETAVILGTGLGAFVEGLAQRAEIPYEDLPHFPRSTAIGHAGRLVIVTLGDRPVLVLQGRWHLYEGYSPEEISFPVKVLRELGVRRLLVSCAAGGLAADLQVGDLLILEDHVDLQFQTRHCQRRWPLTLPFYDSAAIDRLVALARSLKIPSRRGVYAAVTGPNYETRAELRFLRQLADAVGMSTIPEVRAARELGMQVAAIATVTNLCTPDAPQVADGEHVAQAAARSLPRFRSLVLEYLKWEEGVGARE